MKVTPALSKTYSITDAMLTSSGAVDVAAQGEWSSGTTYALGNIASRAQAAGRLKFHRSLQAGNLNQNPDTQTAWWAYIGDGYKIYSGTATYAVGDRVLDNANHRVYEALAAMSNPVPALSDFTKWLPLGPSNRWAMFDLYNNIATVVPGSLPVVITPGQRINAVNLHGLRANSASVTITSGAATVYSQTFNLNKRRVRNLYQWYYEPFSTQRSLALFNLPQAPDRVVTITLTAASGNVECSGCVTGRGEDVGQIEFNGVYDTINFSTVERNFDSSINKMRPQPAVPKNSFRIILPAGRAKRAMELLQAHNGVPASWSALDDRNASPYFELFHNVAFVREASLDHEDSAEGRVNLVLENI